MNHFFVFDLLHTVRRSIDTIRHVGDQRGRRILGTWKPCSSDCCCCHGGERDPWREVIFHHVSPFLHLLPPLPRLLPLQCELGPRVVAMVGRRGSCRRLASSCSSSGPSCACWRGFRASRCRLCSRWPRLTSSRRIWTSPRRSWITLACSNSEQDLDHVERHHISLWSYSKHP